jgi:hypothetical protein
VSPRRRRYQKPRWAVDRLPPPTERERKRERPPENTRPAWATVAPPEWSEGAAALFPEEREHARAFWRWLGDTYTQTRARLWRGYHYLEALTGEDAEAEEHYRALCAWWHWLEAAWWLLTRWYGDDSCRQLVLPFPAAHDGDGRPLRIVREYRGLKGEVVLEDALRLWRDYAILSHQLPDVGEAPPPDLEGPQEGDDAG